MWDLTYQMHLQHLEEMQAYARTAKLLQRAKNPATKMRNYFSSSTLSVLITSLLPAYWSKGRIHSGVEFWADR